MSGRQRPDAREADNGGTRKVDLLMEGLSFRIGRASDSA